MRLNASGAGGRIVLMLGVELERCLCRDEPSPPGMGKWNAEGGESSAELQTQDQTFCNKLKFYTSLLLFNTTYPVGSGVKARSRGIGSGTTSEGPDGQSPAYLRKKNTHNTLDSHLLEDQMFWDITKNKHDKCNTSSHTHAPFHGIQVHADRGYFAAAVLVELVAARLTPEAVEQELVAEVTVR